MATKQVKKNELKFEDFKPVSEQHELPDKYIHIVNLPGFRKEDFRVEIDDITLDSILIVQIKGQKQFGDNKCKRFNKVIQLPAHHIDIEKITVKFVGEVLSLTFPKSEKMRNPVNPPQPIKKYKFSDLGSTPTEPHEKTSLKKDEEVKRKEAETDKMASTQVFINKVGPVGGIGGVMKDMNINGINRIVKISVRHGCVIDGLIVHFLHDNGEESTEVWGGDGGQLSEFNLKDSEYITSVKGYYTNFYGRTVLSSLKFETNMRSFGPYGPEETIPFELPAISGQIIGFYGCSGSYLDALGVYVKTKEKGLEDANKELLQSRECKSNITSHVLFGVACLGIALIVFKITKQHL